jgi:signal transduction histidine kinase
MTPSRFEDQLRDLGLIGPEGSSVGLPLIDPGANLLDGGSPDGLGRLALMAESALAGEAGSNVDGYRDYRGVTVIGSWRWIDTLDIGIATEVDRDEAFAFHHVTARLWVLAAGGLTLLTVILTGIFIVTARRLDATTRRLADLADHLEDEVEARTRQLVVSQDRLRAEVEARDNLMAAVSHELRTPLTAVMGFAGIGSAAAEDLDPDTHQLVDLIVQESAEMADIVDDLLAATRAATGSLALDPEEIDLLAEAESVVARWDPGETRRVTVRGCRAAAIADPARVRQILRNLVSNAMRYGGDTTEVSVDTAPGYAVAVVADDGEPIDDHIRRHMFDLYFRGHDAPGMAPSLGVGLGLSLKLATAMEGTLQFRRTDGRNTFELRLPAAVAVGAEKIA